MWAWIWFNNVMQSQTHWCWAAVASAISGYFSGTWSECAVANGVLNRTDCCSEPSASSTGACNIDQALHTALGVTENFNSMTGPVAREDIEAELLNNRPVGARVAWDGGGAHFLTIYGILEAAGPEDTHLLIADPAYGDLDVLAFHFENGFYQMYGTWTHTYFTQPAPQ